MFERLLIWKYLGNMEFFFFLLIYGEVATVSTFQYCYNASDLTQERICNKGCCGRNVTNSLPCCFDTKPDSTETDPSVYITFFYSVMGFVVILHFAYCCRRISRLRQKIITNQNRSRIIRTTVIDQSTTSADEHIVEVRGSNSSSNHLVQEAADLNVTIRPPTYDEVIKSCYDTAPPPYAEIDIDENLHTRDHTIDETRTN